MNNKKKHTKHKHKIVITREGQVGCDACAAEILNNAFSTTYTSTQVKIDKVINPSKAIIRISVDKAKK